MNAEQKKAVHMALDFLQRTTEDFTPSDSWSDKEWAIWFKANPFQPKMESVSRGILADPSGKRFMEATSSILESTDDTPFSMRRGAWAVIENAIYRRGFFTWWRSIIG